MAKKDFELITQLQNKIKLLEEQNALLKDKIVKLEGEKKKLQKEGAEEEKKEVGGRKKTFFEQQKEAALEEANKKLSEGEALEDIFEFCFDQGSEAVKNDLKRGWPAS